MCKYKIITEADVNIKIKQRLQILLHRNEQNRKLKQSLFRKVRIERKLCSELQDLKKDRIKIDALIQKIMQENSLLKQTSSQHELRQIRRSSVAMRSAHRRHKIMYKNTECKLKKENALLIKKV